MEVVGEYEYNKKDLIGHGAFAVVFKGRYRKTPEIPVAIKSITKKNLAKSQNLLTKEIKILKELSDLHHENVVGLLDCKETTNHVYLVMEYCNGGDLADYLQVKKTLSEDTLSAFLRQICGAMRALNAKGIVHRDLKPQNILMCHSGLTNPTPAQITLKIADFGFARFLQDGVMAATLCGSPMYMAPEVIMSLQYDAKADLWSIGTIVFQCLTGKAPFQAQTPQQLKQFYERNQELMPNIPSGTSPQLKDLLLRLLKRNAKDRIDFESFFLHPFMKQPTPVKNTPPVPVPDRQRSCNSEHANSQSPVLKTVSSSPLSGNMGTSPGAAVTLGGCRSVEKTLTAEGMEDSSLHEADYITVDDEDEAHPDGCVTPTEDFVMVPDHLDPVDTDSLNSEPVSLQKIQQINPAIGRVTYRRNPPVEPPTFEDTQPPSPGRPCTLPVTSPSTSPTSEPIQVPSSVRRSPEQTADCRPSSVGSDIKLGSAPDIGSLSPPVVQFTIGTPPSNQWRRNSGTPPIARNCNTPPSGAGSPHRRPGTTPPQFAPLGFGAPNMVLPPILGSPVKRNGFFDVQTNNDGLYPHETLHAPFGFSRPQTVPDNLAFYAYTVDGSPVRRALMERCPNQPEGQQPPIFANHGLCGHPQLVRAATINVPTQVNSAMVPFGSSPNLCPHDRSPSLSRERTSSMEFDRPGYYRRNPTPYMETSPPTSLLYAQSPPNMEGPVAFVAPQLQEETIMDDQHNETLAKLSFVLDLVECIMELAHTRGMSMHSFSESVRTSHNGVDNMPRFNEAQRRLEQLVLYVRCLHLLSSSLQLAREELKTGDLQPSSALKTVVRQLNDHYHRCLAMCRHIHRQGFTRQSSFTPQLLSVTADKLIYNYAIEMCQTAALDELFGNPQECFRRYTAAQILLHSLAQQSRSTNDRMLLNKYREAVERRLYNLQSQGLAYPYDAYS